MLALTLLLAETLARAVDAWTYVSVAELRDIYEKRRDWRLGRSWPLQRGDYPYLPFVPNPEYPEVNDLGFRGEPFSAEKPEDTYRIFCLGGSTTWNGYPAYLEDTLRDDFARSGLELEVINAGNQCWTSLESLVNFIVRCVPLGPDAVVVYHAINDAIFSFADEYSSDYTHLRKRFEKDDPLVWDYLPRFLDHSAAFVGFRAVFERNVGTRGIEVVIAKDHPRSGAPPYRGVEPLRQNLYTLISVARARGIEVFLCTQAFNREYEYRFHLQRRWADAVDDANEIIRSFADRWDDVHVIDVAAALRGGNDWMTDYCHFTEDGKARLARFIGESIVPRIPALAGKRKETERLVSELPSMLPRHQ
jgi:lysophospholipase L1-like esterase